MKPSPLTILALLLCCAGPASARDPQTFPIQWQVGKTYDQHMEMAQQMTFPGQGEMQTKMTMELSAVPKKGSAPGTTEVVMTYNKADMTIKMGEKDVPGGNDALKKFVGKSVTTVFDEKGKIQSIKNLESLVGDDPMLSRMMSEDSMKQMMGQASLMATPDRPVKPGDSWEFEVDYPMPMMKMSMKGKYTYEKDEEVEGAACARLVLAGTLTMDTGAETPKKEGESEDPQAAQTREMLKAMGFKINESDISGVMHYDFNLGNVAKSEMDMKVTMSMKDPATQQAVSLPMRTKVTQSIKAKDAK